jgi:beta-N-acetylhexosaminidase
MFSKTLNLYDPVWTFLAASMREEPVFRDRVRDAARRILAVKLEYLRGEQAAPYIPDLQKVETGLPDSEGSRFFLDLAARSVTLIKGDVTSSDTAGIFPLSPEKAGKVLLAGQYTDFFTTGRAAYPDAAAYWYSSERPAAELTRQARGADTVIFCLSDADGLYFLRSLQGLGKRVIVFSVLSPVYLEQAPWVDGAIAVYSYAPESFVAGFSAILGRIAAQGRLPLRETIFAQEPTGSKEPD